MLDELALARVDLTAEHVAIMGSTSSAINARNACVLSAAGGPLSKQEMFAPVCAAPDTERAQPLTLDVPTLASKGEPPQGSIELGPLPSEVGLTGRLRLRRLLRVGLFTIEEERLRCLHAVREPTQA